MFQEESYSHVISNTENIIQRHSGTSRGHNIGHSGSVPWQKNNASASYEIKKALAG